LLFKGLIFSCFTKFTASFFRNIIAGFFPFAAGLLEGQIFPNENQKKTQQTCGKKKFCESRTAGGCRKTPKAKVMEIKKGVCASERKSQGFLSVFFFKGIRPFCALNLIHRLVSSGWLLEKQWKLS